MNRCSICLTLIALLAVAGCSGDTAEGGAERRSGGGRPGGGGQRGMSAEGQRGAAVPVEIARVVRRDIASYIETNGALAAENEVDVVARTSGPIVELRVEEGDAVRQGQLLARIDELEYEAQVEIARVAVNETGQAYERAKKLQLEQLISPENFEQALSAHETARAQYESSRLLLGYTSIRAPFDGLIIRRYVNFAEQVNANTALFRVSDFDPLLCPIQVPEESCLDCERDNEPDIAVEAYPDERFEASVLRISPVVDAATGTIKVTLEVRSRGKLRPGMFARVFVETTVRKGALVVPKAALSLESIGDTIYVAEGSTASRREVTLGYTEGDFVEIVSGVAENESVIVVGQDGLSDGTPIRQLGSEGAAGAEVAIGGPEARGPGGGSGSGPGGRRFDPSVMSAEQLERAKKMMRERGLSEEQIAERIRDARARKEP